MRMTHDLIYEALTHAEAILSRSQNVSTNCGGKGPSTTTRKALAKVRDALSSLHDDIDIDPPDQFNREAAE